MFSGIVTALEKAKKIEKSQNSMSVVLPTPMDWNLNEGESVNIDGICSTVKQIEDKSFSVYYMPETLRVTNLSKVSENHEFNLERSLTLNSLVGGHLVAGHIDCVGEVSKVLPVGDSVVLTINLPREFAKYLIYKGSVAVNGVSLTVVEANPNNFVVSLIPYTLKHTNLGSAKVGNQVNIEVDLMAKYLEKLVGKK